MIYILVSLILEIPLPHLQDQMILKLIFWMNARCIKRMKIINPYIQQLLFFNSMQSLHIWA